MTLISKYIKIFFLLICLFSFSIQAHANLTTQTEGQKPNVAHSKTVWQQWAQEDLQTLHHLILTRSTAPLTPPTRYFKNWFNPGYELAKQKVPLVHDYPSYLHLLEYYVYGFHTSHFFLINKPIALKNIRWPGFIVGMQQPPYFQVIYIQPGRTNVPPVGARLLECDGQTPNQLFTRIVKPFMKHDPAYPGYQPLYAYKLFMDDDNPFVHYPQKCVFAIKNGTGKTLQTKSYPLRWTPFSGTRAQYNAILNKVLHTHHKISQQFSIQPLGEQGVWVRVPIFEGPQAASKLAALAQQLPKYRDEHLIVFDVRQNGGGAREPMEKLMTALYGKAYLASLGSKEMLNLPIHTLWRVNTENIEAEKKEDPALSAKMQKAQKQNKDLYQLTIPATISPDTHPSHTNPVKAHVIVLTDERCWSSCWLFVRDMRAIPGVIQVGRMTATMDAYSTPLIEPLHAKVFAAIPMMQFISPKNHFEKPFLPSIIYSGDITDTAKLKEWVLQLAHSGKLNTKVKATSNN